MIVKPDGGCQGKGIFLTQNIKDISMKKTLIVQEYMQEPYLIDNLKFDLRLYVLILSCDPLRLFLYQDGIVRFATDEYQPYSQDSEKKSLNNFCMHLTNYSVNKNQEDFKIA